LNKRIFTHNFLFKSLFTFVVVFFLFVPHSTYSQNNTNKKGKTERVAQKNKKVQPNSNNTLREEIQRYMGYEALPARYLSLPYDTSMNTNVPGGFVDITFILLAFIPIFFLLGYLDKPLKGITFMVFSFLLLLLSIPNSKLVGDKLQVINTPAALNEYINTISFNDAPIGYIIARIQHFFNILYQPLESLFASTSGEKDVYTYPLLIILFIAASFPLQKRMEHFSARKKAGFNFIYIFSFFWLVLTAGIIWYGYLMIALGLLVLTFGLDRYSQEPTKLKKYTTYGMYSMLVVWFVLMIVLRISNFTLTSSPDIAKRLFDPSIVNYQSGRIQNDQVMDKFFPGLGNALDVINKDEDALVYRVGTVFQFFIKKNDSRVLMDNQLGIYNNLNKAYPDKNTLAGVLHASGYRYILVDLMTHTIDKTPEQSLTKKFNTFLNFIYQNPRLELMATNRVVKITRNDGGPSNVREVFGEQIINHGTFAIYRIKN